MYKIATYTILAFALFSTSAEAARFGTKKSPTSAELRVNAPTTWASFRRAGGSSSVHGLATAIAQAEGVNPALVRAVLHVESTGRCGAVSSANARGAMQVKPATARSVGVTGNLLDCRTGITAGVRYLRQALAVNGGNVCAAASSYNTGLGVRGRCSGYGRKVLAAMGGASRVRVAEVTSDDE